MQLHFGIKVLPGKYGLNLIRENYAIINKRNSLGYFEHMRECYDDHGKSYTNKHLY